MPGWLSIIWYALDNRQDQTVLFFDHVIGSLNEDDSQILSKHTVTLEYRFSESRTGNWGFEVAVSIRVGYYGPTVRIQNYFFVVDGGPFFFKNAIASFAFLTKKECLLRSFTLPTLSFERCLLSAILAIPFHYCTVNLSIFSFYRKCFIMMAFLKRFPPIIKTLNVKNGGNVLEMLCYSHSV